MASKEKIPERSLADVRRELDVIDDAIQDLMMKRAELITEVAEAKAATASAAGKGSFVVFRPGREAEVLRRLAERQKGPFPLKAVFRIFREIISTMTARIQGTFRVDVFGADDALSYWSLARDYYGSSVGMVLHDNARDVLRRAGGDPMIVAVLPWPGNYEGGDWWPQLAMAGDSDARVVARLPFLEIASDKEAPTALVVMQAAFEPSGDDTSLVVVTATGDVSDAALAQRVKAAGLNATRIGVALTNDGGPRRHNLFSVAGHVAEDDARVAAISSDTPSVTASVIGGYANPVKRAKDGE